MISPWIGGVEPQVLVESWWGVCQCAILLHFFRGEGGAYDGLVNRTVINAPHGLM